MKPKIVLLNPPSDKNCGRDYYLGGELEAGLCLPPQDLVTLSGALSAHADIVVVDAAAERLSSNAALSRIAGYCPDLVIFLISAATYVEDVAFLGRLRARCPNAKFAGTGDVYRDIKELAFPLNSFVDAVVFDFTTDEIVSYLGDGKDISANLILRNGGNSTAVEERHLYGHWEAPLPRWDLFPLGKYRWPFAGPGPCATLLTDFGCPFLCSYCPMSTLAYKSRDVESVMREAGLLKRLKVRNVFFRDQTFGMDRRRTLELLDRLEKGQMEYSWSCSTRVDLVDEGLLLRMKQAGCAAVMFGIDSGDDEVLRAHKKNTTVAQAEKAVEMARKCGLKTWGTFVIGLAMDTRESIERTLSLAKSLPLDHVSLRVDSSRFAADYRRDMLVKGLVPPEAMPPDTPTSISVWGGRLGVSNSDVFSYYKERMRASPMKASGRGAS